MHDARDAEDKRLLEAGEFRQLVESYYGVTLDRCRTRVWPDDEAIAVAAEVAIRLLSELKRGRRYQVPFRVVVHQVIGWKIKEHFAPEKLQEVELEEWFRGVSTEPSTQLEDPSGFDAMLDGLTDAEQRVLRLRYAEQLEITEIAERLAKSRNAVDQIIHRALTKLRERAA